MLTEKSAVLLWLPGIMKLYVLFLLHKIVIVLLVNKAITSYNDLKHSNIV